MTRCTVFMYLDPDYGTEKLYGDLETLSCRAPNGQTFEIKIDGFISDFRDEYDGASGVLVHRKALQGIVAGFTKDVTKNFGEALSMAQTTSQVVSTGVIGAVTTNTANVTGNQDAYLLGKTIAGATGKWLDNLVDFYLSIAPTVAVPSGTKVFVTIKGEVKVPKMFFGNELKQDQIQELSAKLNQQIQAKEN